ncbi:hypothetical protein DB30_02844 [Enhygromyxa salina]|uniref:Uncharacterized protein n=1 Tax=Enhygromyxa salina TaxID=215803 RepID=A0A0C2D3L4_9BACT|nr:hypothetical protein DB30_02844 [Enhygromyxa salina]
MESARQQFQHDMERADLPAAGNAPWHRVVWRVGAAVGLQRDYRRFG